MNRRSPRAPWRPDSGFYVAYAQLKPRRPFDGQVAGLRTPQDAHHERNELLVNRSLARSVRQQPALTRGAWPLVDRRQTHLDRELHDLRAIGIKER